MTTTVNSIPIRALLGLTKLRDGVIQPILSSTVMGLTDSAAIYSKPPIDLATYGNAVAAYGASIPAALDGGKTAVAQKKKLRGAAIKMYVQIAHYVEATCNDDMATFLLSGFQPVPTTRRRTPPASETIRKVVPGPNSGQLSVTLMNNNDAVSNDLRWAPVPVGSAPTAWTSQLVVGVQKATIVSGLTPGTVYAFQVRALTKTGFTDWSDSVTVMCV